MYIEYRSIADLNNLIIKNLDKFPHDIDLVVGIPRSGMLPANLLALYLNKPFTDIDSFIEGKIYSSGERGRFITMSQNLKILVVDDSIKLGNALDKAKEKLKKVSSLYDIIYAAIIATNISKDKIDVYCEIIDIPRVFQWNLFHYDSIINKACFDIDGVLCQNPPVDDDGPVYKNYIENAIPYILPSVGIDTIVSCRLEKYRPETEAWLKKYNVKYNKLLMLNMSTKAERQAWGKHGQYKGEIYKNSDNILFIESSLDEANIISKISGKQVFCTENFEMIYRNKQINKKYLELKLLIRRLLGMKYYV